MAREIITLEDGRQVHVGWQHGSDEVTVGTVVPATPQRPVDDLTALLAADGTPVGFTGAFRDRRSVNRLIHTLKRARDASFGRDE